VLPADHDRRLARARLSLDGLSIGDAFGERFFTWPERIVLLLTRRELPPAPWGYTDDTVMAISLVEGLAAAGEIDSDVLAVAFARRYAADRRRGYGGTAHEILEEIGRGVPWTEAAGAPFGGTGSMGNGGAMRVGPVGAYFADDLDRAAREAQASARVTHAHPDGQAGAVAVAIAAAVAAQMGEGQTPREGRALLQAAFERTPAGATRDGLQKALALPLDQAPSVAAELLGTGRRVLAWDTVPFALWCAARHLDDYQEAMWTTVSGLGDRDTTCAIAGGVVALSAGRPSLPTAWLTAREPLSVMGG
jgi:ADP-ribosylglycohydrolase